RHYWAVSDSPPFLFRAVAPGSGQTAERAVGWRGLIVLLAPPGIRLRFFKPLDCRSYESQNFFPARAGVASGRHRVCSWRRRVDINSRRPGPESPKDEERHSAGKPVRLALA